MLLFRSERMLREHYRCIDVVAAVVTFFVAVMVYTIFAIGIIYLATLVAYVVSVLVKVRRTCTKCRAASVTQVVALGIYVYKTTVASVTFSVLIAIHVLVRSL